MAEDRPFIAADEGLHFNDADVILRLFILRLFIDAPSPVDSSATADSLPNSDLHIYHHADVLRRIQRVVIRPVDRHVHAPEHSSSSNRDRDHFRLNLGVAPAASSIQSHLTVLELLYTNDFATAVDSTSTALDLLLVALELLFEECMRWLVHGFPGGGAMDGGRREASGEINPIPERGRIEGARG